eukprot:scaffold68492_cov52-Attheya_sp.AAC.3
MTDVKKEELSDDGWKDFNEMPDEVHVLFIEGYCQAAFMQNKFVNGSANVAGATPFSASSTFRVWCTDPACLQNSDPKPDAYGVIRCREEIESGRYHAIVVVDYSNEDQFEAFENDLGSHLAQFTAAGGVIAFPSSEGLLVSTLKKLFDVKWRVSAYFRTTWGPCKENETAINYSFGNGNLSRRVIHPYSAKSVSLRGVPPHERCFGVMADSKTQSSRSPRLPIDCFASLDESVFATILELKTDGNDSFQKGKLDDAKEAYQTAIQQYGAKLGSNGLQRDTHVTVLSNLSLIHLKKKEYLEAERVATKALDMDWSHSKSSYRRAMARLQISKSASSGGDLTRLRGAKKDILNGDPIDATRKLLQRIKNEIERIEKKDHAQFGSGFASALSSKQS